MKMQFFFKNISWIVPAFILLASIRMAEMTHKSVIGLYELQHLEARKDSVRRADEIIQAQAVILASLRQRVEKYRTKTSDSDFASYLEQRCSRLNVKITTLPGLFGQNASGGVLEKFQIQGGFFDMLQLLYDMEIQDQTAQIEHLRWHRQKMMVNGKMTFFLVADVVVRR